MTDNENDPSPDPSRTKALEGHPTGLERTAMKRPRTQPPPQASVLDGHVDARLGADELRAQLAYFRQKAIQLDVLVFEMRALLQSGKGFSEILHIEQLLRAFMAVCRERYGAVTSSVMLLDDLDPESIFYRVRASHGLGDFYIDHTGDREELLMFKLPHDNGLLWQLIHQGDVFSVRDMRKLPRFSTAFRKWNLGVLKSDVWVPLMRGGEVLGVLTLGECDDGSQIPEHEYAFLQEISAVAATNIDSTLKYEKNERILTNLRTLYDVNQQLANVNDFKKLTIDILATAVSALRAQKANLMLYDAANDRLEIKVVWGNIPKSVRDSINDGRTETKSFALGEGVAGQAAKLRKPVRINDRAQIEQVGKNVVHCIMSVPLLYGGAVMGVITLTNKVKTVDDKLVLDLVGRFGDDDAQLLVGLADQAAVNLNKAKLYSASITDRLTGLFNARHFEFSLDALIEASRSSEKPLTLVLTDIDHFKRFNDTHGHNAGDVVLARTAHKLLETVRPGTLDAAFRYGGEEFCLVLPETDGATALEIAELFRQSVEKEMIVYEGRELNVTVSAGVATFPSDGDRRAQLFEAADKALYASKHAGRNRVTRGGVSSEPA